MDVGKTFTDVANAYAKKDFTAAKYATQSDGTLLEDNYKTEHWNKENVHAGRKDQVKEKDYPTDGKHEKVDTLHSTKNGKEQDILITNKHGYKNHKLVIERDGKDNVTFEGSGWKQDKYGYKEGASRKEGTTYKDNHGNEVLIVGEGKTVNIVA